MSTIEENLIAPWIGSGCCKNSLSVVVVSSNNVVVEKISEALLDVHAMGDYRWKLVVLRSLSLEDIVKQSDLTGRLSLDFIVIAVDTSRVFCIDWASRVLEQVHPDLRLRRVVLVNAGNSPVHAMAVNSSEVMTFCSENRVEMLNADVYKQDDANYLAQRLLKYIEVSIGIGTGIPNINI